ncbi:MAG: AI-2E family transporter YdiK [Myxococcaceae bacterium]
MAAPATEDAMAEPVSTLPRTLLSILALAGLLLGSLWVLQPFLLPGIWAVTIVVATWPLLTGLQARFGDRRTPAVLLMTLCLLLIVIVPVYLAIATVIGQSDRLGALIESLRTAQIPPPPEWLQSLPVGSKLAARWAEVAQTGRGALAAKLEPYALGMVRWLGARVGSFGTLILHFLLTVIIATILYARGEMAAHGIRRFFRRLAGDKGDSVVVLAGQSIRAVALGVIVTAVIQTAVSGIGMGIAGIPQAGLLTAVVFLLCIAQVGPFLVMVPGVIWLYASGSPGRGTFFLLWTLVTITMDNVIRPWLITRGANLPMLLIFAGVIGGLLGFGVIGLFIGPVVLAVAYTLVKAWVAEGDAPLPVPVKASPPAPTPAPAPAIVLPPPAA